MLSCNNVLLFFDKKPNNNEISQSIGMVFTCVAQCAKMILNKITKAMNETFAG